ncbi:MAG: phosphatase PAP2 family protein [Rhizobiaceae bacterium]|nr:phosphatase PAP2 family protein [Rhizobiaceae bacterium]
MLLFPAERLVLAIIAVLVCADVALISLGNAAFDWGGYAPLVAIGTALIAIGSIYRKSGRSHPIGLAMIAAGLYILFTLAGSVLNYALLPVGELKLDEKLARFDALIGYSWPDFVGFLAQYPTASLILKVIYISSLVQLMAVLILLGFGGRTQQLHEFLLVGIAGALLAIGFWSVAPTMGPSILYELPAETQARVGLVVTTEYGDKLKELALYGPRVITPDETLGLIAFPSFHTVMALMSIVYAWPLRGLRLLFLTVNTLMVPAILAHGGHHLVDLFAGVLVFCIALYVVRRSRSFWALDAARRRSPAAALRNNP